MIAKWAIRINKMIVLNVTPQYCSHLNAVYMYMYIIVIVLHFLSLPKHLWHMYTS